MSQDESSFLEEPTRRFRIKELDFHVGDFAIYEYDFGQLQLKVFVHDKAITASGNSLELVLQVMDIIHKHPAPDIDTPAVGAYFKAIKGIVATEPTGNTWHLYEVSK